LTIILKRPFARTLAQLDTPVLIDRHRNHDDAIANRRLASSYPEFEAKRYKLIVKLELLKRARAYAHRRNWPEFVSEAVAAE